MTPRNATISASIASIRLRASALAGSGVPRILWTRSSNIYPTSLAVAMSKRTRTGEIRSAYEFIKAHTREHDVRTMCRVLMVAPSGYYAWLQEPVSNRAQDDTRLLRLIRASFTASHGIYGAPQVFLDLRERGKRAANIA